MMKSHITLSFVQKSRHLKISFSGHLQSIMFDMIAILFVVISKQFFPFRQKSDDLCFKLKQFLTEILKLLYDCENIMQSSIFNVQ
jgi:hypothetical protein